MVCRLYLNIIVGNLLNYLNQILKYQIINYLGWNEFFLSIECSDSEENPRNKSEMIDDLQTKDIDFKKAYFVGDTTGDASAAISKNLKFIKAGYGYGRNQDWSQHKIHREIKKIEDLI